MDLRVLFVFVSVVYANVCARIMCNFQPKNWSSAIQHCLNLIGTSVDKSKVWSLAGLQLNASFWTADYVSKIKTLDFPIDCEYRTMVTDNQISQTKFGNCSEIRNYICCDNTIIKSCVKNGTWQEASKCNETYSTIPVQLPIGDYWARTAFGYKNYVFTGGRLQNLYRCGMLDVAGNFTFVNDCETSKYSFCEVENYTGTDLSACGSTITTNRPSSNNLSTIVSQKAETLTATIMSINDNISTKSIVRNHASTSSDSTLGIGLGVSLSIVVMVIVTIVGVCVYKRRKRNSDCVRSRQECGSTECGDIHVYDEISNGEESAYAASKVDIYDKIRTDEEKEHAYESVASAPKY